MNPNREEQQVAHLNFVIQEVGQRIFGMEKLSVSFGSPFKGRLLAQNIVIEQRGTRATVKAPYLVGRDGFDGASVTIEMAQGGKKEQFAITFNAGWPVPHDLKALYEHIRAATALKEIMLVAQIAAEQYVRV